MSPVRDWSGQTVNFRQFVRYAFIALAQATDSRPLGRHAAVARAGSAVAMPVPWLLPGQLRARCTGGRT